MDVLSRLRALFLRAGPPTGTAAQWVGGALLLVAAGCAAHSWKFIEGQERSLATVIENVSSFAPGGGVRYAPRLRFRTADGVLLQMQTMDFSSDGEFSIGETLPVLYPAGKPQLAVVATPWRVYHTAIVLGIWGVILFDIGLILRLVLRRIV